MRNRRVKHYREKGFEKLSTIHWILGTNTYMKRRLVLALMFLVATQLFASNEVFVQNNRSVQRLDSDQEADSDTTPSRFWRGYWLGLGGAAVGAFGGSMVNGFNYRVPIMPAMIVGAVTGGVLGTVLAERIPIWFTDCPESTPCPTGSVWGGIAGTATGLLLPFLFILSLFAFLG